MNSLHNYVATFLSRLNRMNIVCIYIVHCLVKNKSLIVTFLLFLPVLNFNLFCLSSFLRSFA